MKKITTLILTGLLAIPSFAKVPVYLDPTADIEARVEDALSRMTLEEKVKVLHAQSKFSAAGVPRLGIPELWTTDGPHGIRPEVMWDEWDQARWTNDSCIAFPALTCLAATWDPSLAYTYGKALGEEARYRKKDILLGPGVNIMRTPLNGRNFEYMGEDPYLASIMVVPYIQGLQSNGVAACVKHFALNNHEVNRHTTNVSLSDRALHEIYLPAFKAAVQKGGAWSLMGAYNLIGDQHLCHNDRMLMKILKGDWGFDGAVVSDWGGTHDTDEAIENGLDLEFGSWTDGLSNGASNAYDYYYLANPYLERLKSGQASEEVLNDKVRRVLRLAFRTTMDRNRPFGSFCSPEHSAAAREVGRKGIVLLKNDRKLLPLDPKSNIKVAVIGENAIKMMTVGGGSSSLKALYEISPLDGLREAFGPQAVVAYARGYVGDPTGEYNGVVSGQDLTETRSQAELTAEAVALARNSDVVIFVGGLNKASGQDCEDSDRASLGLPYGQDELIEALAAANKNIVVVNISGNPVAMPWLGKVRSVVQGWYLGSEAGHSLADVLTGKCNPSGKLPCTFYATLDQVGAHATGSYPGVKRADSDIVDCNYDEDIFVGYRWIDSHKQAPLFPFGHGLSYTTYKYGKPKASASAMTDAGTITITVPVKNIGSVAGSETVQLYISDIKSSLPRPEKELKGFEQIQLQPGAEGEVTFTISKEALEFYNPGVESMVAEPGKFKALIGASSGDIRQIVEFELRDGTLALCE
ncbi:MAG: glycoside hydrolase family 3 C-terminal domain-containing protein [Muribaculaceae bacterium]|nr:glycoside hydrolase family 3 C-terminal domain-containing protein [Muribaculaceae bacterium]